MISLVFLFVDRVVQFQFVSQHIFSFFFPSLHTLLLVYGKSEGCCHEWREMKLDGKNYKDELLLSSKEETEQILSGSQGNFHYGSFTFEVNEYGP